MDIAILFYDEMAALDAIGPWEVLQHLPGVTMHSVGVTPGPKSSEPAGLELVAAESIDDVPAPDVLVVPGGSGEAALRRDPKVLEWLRGVDATSQWTTSVCTGSLLLGAAGLLDGYKAASYWMVRDLLPLFGAELVKERVVVDRNRITGGGATAGLDFGLTLASAIRGADYAKMLQLAVEYDPHPPFDAGAPETAPQPVVEHLWQMRDDEIKAARAAATAAAQRIKKF
jgi:cyclohexyl-isocyanide hydratase